MARDYKNSSARGRGKAQQRRGLPGWLWLMAGLLIGLLIALVVHLHHLGDGERIVIAPPPESRETPPAQTEQPQQPAEQPSKPRFEFYKLLPEQEVVVPEPARKPEPEPQPRRQPEQRQREPAPEPSRPPADDGTRYVLQAGSFQTFSDADRLRAQLALIGVEAHIQRVNLTGGETWHRVRVGPFDSRQDLNSVRSRLQTNGIETILLKLSG